MRKVLTGVAVAFALFGSPAMAGQGRDNSRRVLRMLQLENCRQEGKNARGIAENRAQGVTLQELIKKIEAPPSDGSELDDKVRLHVEKLAARVYGGPKLSPDEWDDLAYQSCVETIP